MANVDCLGHPEHTRCSPSAPAAPGVFERCLAGTQLAWLLQQLEGGALSAALPQALPCLLACLDDASPHVQCCGLAALRHCAVKGDIRCVPSAAPSALQNSTIAGGRGACQPGLERMYSCPGQRSSASMRSIEH